MLATCRLYNAIISYTCTYITQLLPLEILHSIDMKHINSSLKDKDNWYKIVAISNITSKYLLLVVSLTFTIPNERYTVATYYNPFCLSYYCSCQRSKYTFSVIII